MKTTKEFQKEKIAALIFFGLFSVRAMATEPVLASLSPSAFQAELKPALKGNACSNQEDLARAVRSATSSKTLVQVMQSYCPVLEEFSGSVGIIVNQGPPGIGPIVVGPPPGIGPIVVGPPPGLLDVCKILSVEERSDQISFVVAPVGHEEESVAFTFRPYAEENGYFLYRSDCD